MQSAFIDIGLERAAFLHVADIWEERHGSEPERPIEQILHEGQTLMVQVIKDPIGTKGARLSTQISFAGRYLVYLPQETHIGISQKIEGEEERELLRQKLHQLMPEGATRRLHRAHHGRNRRGCRDAGRHRLSAAAVEQHPVARQLRARPACCTRISTCRCACCAISSTATPAAS